MKYIIYFFILFLLSCSMNTTSNINKVSNVEFKINKKVGVQIND